MWLAHHGVKGQHWGVRNGPPYPIDSVNTDPSNITKVINEYANSLKKEPTGNQNCLLCTLCAEQRFRGKNALPRAVYSPRDPIFKLDPKTMVNNAIVIKNVDYNKINNLVKMSGNNSRYYVHVKWSEGSGGHEFLVINKHNKPYVLDAQNGIYSEINSKYGKEYFKNIDSKNSYAFRIDNKELNNNFLELNNDKYKLDWDEEKDIKFMKDNGML